MFRIGPFDLTLGTLSPDTSATIPTVTDNAFHQGIITDDLVGISFQPTISVVSDNGELTFGGINESKFVGEITHVPISESSADHPFSTPSLRVSFSRSFSSERILGYQPEHHIRYNREDNLGRNCWYRRHGYHSPAHFLECTAELQSCDRCGGR